VAYGSGDESNQDCKIQKEELGPFMVAKPIIPTTWKIEVGRSQ
jgi:hypothetical protein